MRQRTGSLPFVEDRATETSTHITDIGLLDLYCALWLWACEDFHVFYLRFSLFSRS